MMPTTLSMQSKISSIRQTGVENIEKFVEHFYAGRKKKGKEEKEGKKEKRGKKQKKKERKRIERKRNSTNK
jgi:hypothetical protein